VDKDGFLVIKVESDQKGLERGCGFFNDGFNGFNG
jgi:hypothetical protein